MLAGGQLKLFLRTRISTLGPSKAGLSIGWQKIKTDSLDIAVKRACLVGWEQQAP
jgi:hypothetical protein